MNTNGQMLNEAIADVLNKMEVLDPTSDGYEKCTNRLKTLQEAKLAEDKVILDREEKEARREMEEKHHSEEMEAKRIAQEEDSVLKRKQIKTQWIIALVSAGVTVGLELLKIHNNNVLAATTFKFEENGTIVGKMSNMVLKKIFR